MLTMVLILGCLSLQDADPITVDPRGFGNSSLEITTTVAPVDVAELWQTGPFCGANSLYVLLRLEGLPVDHKAIRAEVPTTQKGANLAQLKEAAGRHGLPCEVASISPTDLKPAMAPFIALLGLKSAGSINGHFVVVVGMDERTIYTIDGTTGNFDKLSRSVFNQGDCVTMGNLRWWATWRPVFLGPEALVGTPPTGQPLSSCPPPHPASPITSPG